MIGLIQRVSSARVDIDASTAAAIAHGIVAFIGVERGDTAQRADGLLHRIVNYRIFPDSRDRMNLSLLDIRGDLLLVPNFTLPADTRKGNRPSFTPAAPPESAEQLFSYLCAQAQGSLEQVGCGRFGADMQVTLTNDGPVTFWLTS
ncbi:MAG: D-aminoacyl-tRNA deacylase [Pseudomonadota bacterium]|nr:D-aminoacyl-tRNA deacylase [Pseudomonadota bacterium]